ncbi:MAG: hypothetical protein AAB425_00645, partial [Bdellovibrionota bacterium]
FVMEVETPVNKRDLVRYKDEYGRTGQGYEDASQHSYKTQNYNYITFNERNIPHNFKKRIGHCSINFIQVDSDEEMAALLHRQSDDILSVLSGKILNEAGETVLAPGKTISVETLRQLANGKREGSLDLIV